MRTCYVALPAGVKTDPDGRKIDFDHLYAEVLQPTIEELAIECRRLEELIGSGTTWHRTMFTAILTSDLMIADISTHNANVLYELGIRHAVRRNRTIMISAGGPLPSNVGIIPALFYEIDETGRLAESAAEQFKKRLSDTIRLSQRVTISDSPLYEFFPDLEVLLPSELNLPSAWLSRRRDRRRTTLPGLSQQISKPETVLGDLKQRELEIRSEGDPIDFLTQLRAYRDVSAWDDLIRLAGEAPPSVAQSPEVRQLLALALNRRGNTGDQDQAIMLMEQLYHETGGDAATSGVLGSFYKDRYTAALQRGNYSVAEDNRRRALDYYRMAFENNPKDYYAGINVVSLLSERDDAGELRSILDRVRAAVRERVETDVPEFWDLAAQLQLAAIARDWVEAESAARRAVDRASATWMLETTRRSVSSLGDRMTDPAQQEHLRQLDAILARSGAEA